ncbi:MAG: acyl-CoA dehydrogenase family protein [Caldilineaceae bacterium]|nr:acyl-CoA dehydrogenase family protein [Caldilineaceae bacterium]
MTHEATLLPTAVLSPDSPPTQAHTAGLFACLPILYGAWAAAELTPVQLTHLRDRCQAQPWLTQAERGQLQAWLNPATPPTAAQLKQWQATIQQAIALLPAVERQQLSPRLATLGQAVARASAPDDVSRCTTAAASAALADLEGLLGVVSQKAYAKLLGEAWVASVATPSTPTGFDQTHLTALLDGDQAALRQRVRALLSEPRFTYGTYPDKEAYRDQVLTWCKILAEEGLGAVAYPQAYGGQADMAQYLAIMETLSYHDLSLVIKFGVQFGLFGGSIHLLGTTRHHEQYLPAIGQLTLPGAFAMTELGHGSNVRDLETTAHYDPTTEEFIIHTPTETARKEYIGNAARHGRLATVFAQLHLHGAGYGVHAFLVPLRAADGTPLPGIRIEDNGEKMGLNGVDNGRIWFTQVRVPRTALLNRFAEVTPEGEYQSPIASEAKRFFTMIGTLVAGRIGIAGAALSAAKAGLTIAIRYADQRRQFGGAPGEAETRLLDYQTHQRRLMPLLANAYALDFALKDLVRRFTQHTDDDLREVETLAAGLKALSSWNTTRTLQISREACGGQGYLAENRFAALKADTDIFTTFEGDNTVLMQLVAKNALANFKQQFSDMTLLRLVRYITNQASQTAVVYNPMLTRNTDVAHLHDSEFHLTAFRYREQRLVTSLARRLRARLERGIDAHAATIACQDHLVNLAQAYVERVILEQFVCGVTQVDEPALHKVLKQLCDLYALWQLEQHKGWYLETGYFEGNKTRAIRRQIDNLCGEISQAAVALVDAFAIPDPCLAAPIARVLQPRRKQ